MIGPLPGGPVWPHTVRVQGRAAAAGMGDTYAPVVELPCFAEEAQKMVRDAASLEVVSSAQIYMGFDPAVPVGSLVSVWGGSWRRVLAVERHQAPGWPAYQMLAVE